MRRRVLWRNYQLIFDGDGDSEGDAGESYEIHIIVLRWFTD